MKDSYSLTERGKQYDTPIELFRALEGRMPKDGEFLSCWLHDNSFTGKRFLQTFDFKEEKCNH